MGDADYLVALQGLRRVGVSLWSGLALVYGMGLCGRVPLSSRISRVFEPAGQRATGQQRLPRSFHGSSFGRLLPGIFDQFPASDLVCCDGGQSDTARVVWVADKRAES